MLESTASFRGAPFAAFWISCECLGDPRIYGRVIEFVLAIVGKKKLQTLTHQGICDNFAAERTLNQNRSTVPHIAGDHVVRQCGPPNVTERSIHRVDEIETRVDQRTVQVEDHQLDGVRIKCAASSNHESSE